ncbi:unnamed protein product [Urochloa decumbens]|uniref:Uncharacterized protein n=1 Tax=Urochloa decumbens TaxID=240449 RepID=A0ABC9DVZ1_9POAL
MAGGKLQDKFQDDDVRVGVDRFPEQHHPIGATAPDDLGRDYAEAEPPANAAVRRRRGIAWAFGAAIFALVYCTAGVSGGHINPAVTFGLLLARKLSLTRAAYYTVMQCLGAVCGAGVVKALVGGAAYEAAGGGANAVSAGYTKGDGLGAEILGTFVLVYTVFSATDAKRSAREGLPRPRARAAAHWVRRVPRAPGHDPDHWHERQPRQEPRRRHHLRQAARVWIFWVGPFTGAALAAVYHQVVIRAIPFKSSTRY